MGVEYFRANATRDYDFDSTGLREVIETSDQLISVRAVKVQRVGVVPNVASSGSSARRSGIVASYPNRYPSRILTIEN
jgi:hypothetical protein